MRSSVVKNRDGISLPLRLEGSSCFVGVVKMNGRQWQLFMSLKATMNVTQLLTASCTKGDCYTVVPLERDIYDGQCISHLPKQPASPGTNSTYTHAASYLGSTATRLRQYGWDVGPTTEVHIYSSTRYMYIRIPRVHKRALVCSCMCLHA